MGYHGTETSVDSRPRCPEVAGYLLVRLEIFASNFLLLIVLLSQLAFLESVSESLEIVLYSMEKLKAYQFMCVLLKITAQNAFEIVVKQNICVGNDKIKLVF